MLRRLLLLSIFAIAFGCVTPGVSAQQPYYYHCWFGVPGAGGPGGTMYSSGVIAAWPTQGLEADIVGKYSPSRNTSASTCRRFSASPDQQQYSMSMEEKKMDRQSVQNHPCELQAGRRANRYSGRSGFGDARAIHGCRCKPRTRHIESSTLAKAGRDGAREADALLLLE
jgi:hypothetical protein